MRPHTASRVSALLGAEVVGAEPVRGGYTPAERWRVTLHDDRTVFVKVATNGHTRDGLRQEHAVYRVLDRAPFVPELLGFEDHPERPLLVLEDLSHARWPPPWDAGDLERVRRTVAQIEAHPAPLPRLDLESDRQAWRRIQDDPAAFLSTRVCTLEWLEHALPRLLDAGLAAPTEGDVLLHMDLRSDNLCLLDGDDPRVVMVDWNWSRRGPPGLDLAYMAQSVRLEGGPLPDEFAPDSAVYAPWVSGFFASQAGLPHIPSAPRVRRFQHRQLRIALHWTARVLDLPPPDGDWARRALARLDHALEQGTIDEATWFAETEEALVDAYLRTDGAREGSGKSGDAQDWRWSRELVLDALPPGGSTVLDVGSANGHLMDSLERWGAQRGLDVQAHGLEVSARLVAVARRRLPRLAGRMHVGNALTWSPPRRYDLVHTGLDYVPKARRRALVAHLLAEGVAPGGRLVIRPERVGGSEPDPAVTLAELGFAPAGVLERAHPVSGELRRTAYLLRAAR